MLVGLRYMGEERHEPSLYDTIKRVSKYLYFTILLLIGVALLNSVRKITAFLKDSALNTTFVVLHYVAFGFFECGMLLRLLQYAIKGEMYVSSTQQLSNTCLLIS